MSKQNKFVALTTEQKDLVKNNMSWARAVANKYSRVYSADKEMRNDIFQEAILGMMRAAVTWDPERSAFTTYSNWWMRSFINRFIKLRKAERVAYTKSYVCDLSDEEKNCYRITSLDVDFNNEDSSTKFFHDIVADESSEFRNKIMDSMEVIKLKRILFKHAKGLKTKRKIEIAHVFLEFRLFAENPVTSKQLVETLGVTRQRIDQVSKELFNKAGPEIEAKLGKKVNWNGHVLNS